MHNPPVSTLSSAADESKPKRHGFTIVELLIVIVVIGILAAISIVAYNGIQARASMPTKETAMSNVHKLFELHRIEHGAYPDLFDDDAGEHTLEPLTSAGLSADNIEVNQFEFGSYDYQKDTLYIASYHDDNSSTTEWEASYMYWNNYDSEWVLEYKGITLTKSTGEYADWISRDNDLITDSNGQPGYL